MNAYGVYTWPYLRPLCILLLLYQYTGPRKNKAALQQPSAWVGVSESVMNVVCAFCLTVKKLQCGFPVTLNQVTLC